MLPRGSRGWEPFVLSLVIVTVALAAAYLLFRADHYAFLYFGDGSAHLVRARQFVDSQIPGIHNLGTAWLPLYHLLLILPALIDPLFFSGAAGLVVGIPSLLGGAVLLYLLALRLSGSRFAAFFASLLFALNPNLLYVALTPMTEPVFLFMVVGGAYCFLRWWEEDRVAWLAAAAAVIAMATLTRYEAWILPPALLLGVALHRRQTGGLPGRRFREYGLAGLSITGICLWLCWNSWEYGNPLEFVIQIGGAGHAYVRAAQAYQPVPVLALFSKTALHIYGPLLPVLAGVGAFHLLRSGPARRRAMVVGLIVLPALFTFLSLYLGYALMDEYWWNSRYLLTLALPLSLGAALALAHLHAAARGASAASVLVCGLLAFPVFQLTSPKVDVVTYRDAVQNFFDRTVLATEVGEHLREQYDGGNIALVTGSVEGQRIVLPAGIPLRQYYMPFDRMTDSTCRDLSAYRYIVIAKQPSHDAGPCREYWLERMAHLFGSYAVALENRGFLLLVREKERQQAAGQVAGWQRTP